MTSNGRYRTFGSRASSNGDPFSRYDGGVVCRMKRRWFLKSGLTSMIVESLLVLLLALSVLQALGWLGSIPHPLDGSPKGLDTATPPRSSQCCLS
jgi:hypothetical protein